MYTRILSFAAATAIGTSLLFAEQPAQADVIYDTSASPTFTAGAALNRRIVASDFVLDADAKVTDVHFWTAELSTFAFAGSTLEYYFYQGGSAPAAANLITSGAAQNLQRTQVNSTANCIATNPCLGHFYEFDLEVTDQFDALAGQTYWLALYFRNGGSSPAAYWSTTSAAAGLGDCSTDQAGTNLNAATVTFNCPTAKISYAYELTGTDIPEPASAALLLGGLAALGFGASRRRR